MLVRYKNPPRNKEILTLPPLTMQENSYQDQHLHSHAPINLAHTMRNPLTPASLSHLYMPVSCINTSNCPNILYKCIWAKPHQPKNSENCGAAVGAGTG